MSRKQEMSLGDDLDVEGLSPSIPLRGDYVDYTYDPQEIADSTRTQASSTRDYKFENGRRYHAYREGQYPMPNDDLNAENERVAHHMFGIMLQDKLYLAPLEEPKNVIDIGTGTGLWAFDMAEKYPDTEILGLDLTPPPQSLSSNLQFQVDDVTNEWMPNEGYDLVHIRLLFGGPKDWPSLYAKIFENMKPGGYVQQIEFEVKPRCDDGTLPPHNIFQKWAKLTERSLDDIDPNYHIAEQMKPRLVEAGFVDIVERRYRFPLGPWSSDPMYQDLGRYYELFFRTGCQGWLMAVLTRDQEWTPAQVNESVEEAFKIFDKREMHIYYEAILIYAKKPEE